MFQLLPREQALLVFVLTATLLGAAVKHWRDGQREKAASVLSPERTTLADGRADR